MNNILAVGDILCDIKQNTRYRLISISEYTAIICEMDISNLKLYEYETTTLLQLIYDGELQVMHDEDFIFDKENLPESYRKKYEATKGAIGEVLNVYHNRLTELSGKSSKLELYEILKKYSISKSSFWRTLTKYMQSGMRNYTLVDARLFGHNKGLAYNYSVKPGKKSDYFESVGVVLTDEIIGYFEEALKEYRSGRHKNLKSCYDRMNAIHFTKTEMIDGIPSLILLPESQRPTMRQFYYYANKHLTEQEKDAIKTSAQEQRNNKRLITSDSMFDVYGPGDMVEIDACEADVSLVSSFDPNKSIGRPIVYFMVDVFTRVILAVSVAFDNNSILGITNLFLNLADEKQEYCSRFGMGFDNPKIWPSNIIPRRVRVDRGAELKSKAFDRICNELHIEKQIVPGASGSLKGIVEQSFHQMHSKQNAHLEDYGLIEKRYDSDHHKEATLTLEQYTKIVINFVLTHNQEYDKEYPLTKEMIEYGIRPIPALLWDYGIKKNGNPRPISDKNQYLYNLMTPVKAKIDRRGISYKGLYYLPENDSMISREMFKAGTKKVPFEARMDLRDVGHIYYLRGGQLIDASLNKRLTGNADYDGMTFKQYEDYHKLKKQMDAEGRFYNEELAVFNYSVNASVVAGAKKNTYSEVKNMRPAREAEKQAVSHKNRIASKMDSIQMLPRTSEIGDEFDNDISVGEEKLVGKATKDYSNFEEALEDFWENN